MKNLKRLGIAFILITVLAVVAFAGETNSPPCAPPQPGEIQSPPCASAQMLPGDSVDPGQTNTPPASNTGSEFSVTDMALSVMQSVLSIF